MNAAELNKLLEDATNVERAKHGHLAAVWGKNTREALANWVAVQILAFLHEWRGDQHVHVLWVNTFDVAKLSVSVDFLAGGAKYSERERHTLGVSKIGDTTCQCDITENREDSKFLRSRVGTVVEWPHGGMAIYTFGPRPYRERTF